MREALAEALQDYDGALVVVAHDRHLLRATTDALWLVADGAVVPFDGDLDDYRDWVLARSRRFGRSRGRGRPRATARRRNAPRPNRGSANTRSASRYIGKLAKLEREMDALNAEKKRDRGLARVTRRVRRRRQGGAEGTDRAGRATSPGSSPGSKRNGSKSPKPSRSWNAAAALTVTAAIAAGRLRPQSRRSRAPTAISSSRGAVPGRWKRYTAKPSVSRPHRR